MSHLIKRFYVLLIILILADNARILGQDYVPGEVYYGRNEYTAYYPGNLPLIFSAGHGGSLTPAEIPDRTYGTTVTDSKTIDTALEFRSTIFNATGRYPHIIINRLKRTKLDPNREIVEAAQGNQWAEQAWYEYHGFIDVAKDSITANFGKGFYIDVHGHGHSIKRLELGYLISSSNLQRSDSGLNSQSYANMSSIKALVAESPANFPEVLRGSKSLGTLFEERGIPAVPSMNQPDPGAGNPYFSGGYSVERHGSRDGGTISGVQIEAHYEGIRDNATNRRKYAETLMEILNIYFQEHYGWEGIVTRVQQITSAPAEFMLHQNYPNPFNASTIIRFSLPVASHATITIFNLRGEHMETLISKEFLSGTVDVAWDAADKPSGMYFYQLRVHPIRMKNQTDFVDYKKLTLIK
ncbi:T9SS type A sorting domain-containing protein [candidate division KSB1 bacterium]|nr:T9SS type A sorting domain-containing protein [candidate division KSB1 bacterium]